MERLRGNRRVILLSVRRKGLESKGESLLSAEFLQPLQGLRRQCLRLAVKGLLVGAVQGERVLKLKSDDDRESGQNCGSDFQKPVSSVDFLALHEAVIVARQHGREEPRELQALGNAPFQPVIGAERLHIDCFLRIFLRADLCEGLGEHIRGFPVGKDAQDVFPVVDLQEFVNLMKAPLGLFVARRENDDQKFRLLQGIVDPGRQILVETELIGIPKCLPEVLAGDVLPVYGRNLESLDAVLDPLRDHLIGLYVSV